MILLQSLYRSWHEQEKLAQLIIAFPNSADPVQSLYCHSLFLEMISARNSIYMNRAKKIKST